jgi:DNA-binding transcriptional MerR regulator
MAEELTGYRREKFAGVTELADAAARLVSRFVPAQGRGSVTEVPDERTVRYYLSEGLLSPSTERQGTASVFGYLHLLQLLTIKRLQAEGLPIRKIRELMEGMGERGLERMLGVEGQARERGAKPSNAALSYLESLLTGVSRRSAEAAPSPPPQSALLRCPPDASPTAGGNWRRVEIEPGLELHVREDYSLPHDSRVRQRLARMILSEIERHARVPEK